MRENTEAVRSRCPGTSQDPSGLDLQLQLAGVRFTFWAVGVLQTEAGFMAFSHLGPIERQQVVVGEHLDAVVVPEERLVISIVVTGGLWWQPLRLTCDTGARSNFLCWLWVGSQRGRGS